MWLSGDLTADTLYWEERLSDWQPLRTIKSDLDSKSQQQLPTQPQTPTKKPLPKRSGPQLTVVHVLPEPPQPAEKRIIPALLLWFFLGGFGANAFYAGQSGQSCIYLLLFAGTILFSAFEFPIWGFCALALAIFLIVDIIRVLTGIYKRRQRKLHR